jgi:hypothetical protein
VPVEVAIFIVAVYWIAGGLWCVLAPEHIIKLNWVLLQRYLDVVLLFQTPRAIRILGVFAIICGAALLLAWLAAFI